MHYWSYLVHPKFFFNKFELENLILNLMKQNLHSMFSTYVSKFINLVVVGSFDTYQLNASWSPSLLLGAEQTAVNSILA